MEIIQTSLWYPLYTSRRTHISNDLIQEIIKSGLSSLGTKWGERKTAETTSGRRCQSSSNMITGPARMALTCQEQGLVRASDPAPGCQHQLHQLQCPVPNRNGAPFSKLLRISRWWQKNITPRRKPFWAWVEVRRVHTHEAKPAACPCPHRPVLGASNDHSPGVSPASPDPMMWQRNFFFSSN